MYPDITFGETPSPSAAQPDNDSGLLKSNDVRLMQVALTETITAIEQGLYKINTMTYAVEAVAVARQLYERLEVLRQSLREGEPVPRFMSKSL